MHRPVEPETLTHQGLILRIRILTDQDVGDIARGRMHQDEIDDHHHQNYGSQLENPPQNILG